MKAAKILRMCAECICLTGIILSDVNAYLTWSFFYRGTMGWSNPGTNLTVTLHNLWSILKEKMRDASECTVLKSTDLDNPFHSDWYYLSVYSQYS